MLFFTLGTVQFGIALGGRAQPGSWTNPFLLVAVAATFALQLAGLYLPWLQELLNTQALTATQVAAVCALSVLSYLAARIAHAGTVTTARLVAGIGGDAG